MPLLFSEPQASEMAPCACWMVRRPNGARRVLGPTARGRFPAVRWHGVQPTRTGNPLQRSDDRFCPPDVQAPVGLRREREPRPLDSTCLPRGRVHFVADEIDLALYRALATIAGQESGQAP